VSWSDRSGSVRKHLTRRGSALTHSRTRALRLATRLATRSGRTGRTRCVSHRHKVRICSRRTNRVTRFAVRAADRRATTFSRIVLMRRCFRSYG
jgi:hypothetical protein